MNEVEKVSQAIYGGICGSFIGVFQIATHCVAI